jgi:SulP family sulfate permease
MAVLRVDLKEQNRYGVTGVLNFMFKKYVLDLKYEFKKYRFDSFKRDMFAGITVTAVALPLALAFGVASGATASAGLITAIISGLIIGSLAGGSFQISGPTGAMSAILISLVMRNGLMGIWLGGVISGIILILAGVLKLGKFVSFIPGPVVTGFTSGIALVIVAGQLDNFFGVTMPASESAALRVYEYARHFPLPNFFAVGTAAAVIVIMLFWKPKWNKVVPSSLAALVIVSVPAALFNFPLEVIGTIPRTLLPSERLLLKDIFALETITPVIIPSISIAALGMIESLLCGEVAARMTGKEYDANRDLAAQGIGNILIPFFGGVPATAAIARTSVGIKAGGETRLVSIIHALGLLLSIFLLSPIMSRIPVSALAGVLIVTAVRMNDWSTIKYLWKHKFKTSIVEFMVTMFATFFLDLTNAILIGIAFELTLFVIRAAKVSITVRHIEQKCYGKHFSNADFLEKTRVIYFNGPFFFGTANQLRSRIKNLPDNIHTVILSLRGVSLIDPSGIQVLDDIRLDLLIRKCSLKLSGLQPNVEKMLKKSDFIDKLGVDSIFGSADQAIFFLADDNDGKNNDEH